MVDQRSKDYLGVYAWADDEDAQNYVDWLSRLLSYLSTKGSVWYELLPGEVLEDFLASHRRAVTNPPTEWASARA
jgi:hypothetical protein